MSWSPQELESFLRLAGLLVFILRDDDDAKKVSPLNFPFIFCSCLIARGTCIQMGFKRLDFSEQKRGHLAGAWRS